MKKLVLIVAVTMGLLSCASLPVPNNLSDGMLLIDHDINISKNLDFFGQYRIVIKSTTGDYQKIFRIPTRKSISRVLLPEGEYVVKNCDFVYNHGGHGNSYGFDAKFKVKAGEISVFPLSFLHLVYMEGQDYWMSLDIKNLNAVEMKSKVEDIAHIKNFELWSNKYNVEPVINQ